MLSGSDREACDGRAGEARRFYKSDIHTHSTADVLFTRLGQFFQPTSYRKALTGMPNGPATARNVKRDG